MFTAEICGKYDQVECFVNTSSKWTDDNALLDTNACSSSYWCTELCGDMCDEGDE